MFELKAVVKGAAALAAAFCMWSSMSIAYAQSVRPEVGKPLQAAGEALKAKRYADAAAKVRDADNAPNKTPAEQLIIERMRGAVAAASGDTATALRSYEAIIASGKLPAAEQTRMVEAVAGMYYQQRDFSKAAIWYQRYVKEGGTDPQVRTMLTQSYYQSGDCASVSRTLQSDTQGDDSAGRAPPEDQLQMLLGCYMKAKDSNGVSATVEKLATWYPKREYWVNLLNGVQARKGFSDRLSLDVYRLKLAAGLMEKPSDYLEMAQMALGDDYTAEAKKIVDQGYASKVLGTGGDTARQQRLADLAAKRYAEGQASLAKDEAAALSDRDGNNLVAVGYNYVGYGQAAKGLALMEQGIKKGNLRRPDDARLHLGIAYLQAGQKAKAIQTLKTVGGTDGTADLARLWTLQARRAA